MSSFFPVDFGPLPLPLAARPVALLPHMMVRCPRPVQMPMWLAEPTAPTVLVAPLIRACSHLLTGDALLACAFAASATSGSADKLTKSSAMRRVSSTNAPGRGRDRPPPPAATSTSPTTSSSTAARGVDEGAASSSRRCCLAAAGRRARGCRGHGALLGDHVGPDAARAGVEVSEERARWLERSVNTSARVT